MKRVLILTIALLSIASMAFSDFAVSGQATYGMAVGWAVNGSQTYVNHATDNDNRIYFKSSTESVTSYVELRLTNTQLGTGADSVDCRSYYIQLNILNALAVKDLPFPLKIIVQLGQDEEKNTQVWDISAHQLERQDATDLKLITHSVGWFIRTTVFDMVTLTVGQETYKTGAENIYNEAYRYPCAKTMVDLTAKYSIVSADVAIFLEDLTNASADTTLALNAGAMVDLSSILGFMTLKISAVIGRMNLFAYDTVASPWQFGAAVRAEYVSGDFKVVGSVSTSGFWATPTSKALAGVGAAVEIWPVKFIGLGLATTLGLAASNGNVNFAAVSAFEANSPVNMIGNIEIMVLANLGGVTIHAGYIYVPADVTNAAAGTLPFGARKIEFGIESLPYSANTGIVGGFAFRAVAKL